METNVMVGTFTAYTNRMTTEQLNVFSQATKGLEGVDYTPLAVSTQLVSGTNYRFFCNSKGVYPNSLNEGAIVTIYQPLQGQPHVTSIHRCQ